jgi:predicted SAM-dependent methyltransferase
MVEPFDAAAHPRRLNLGCGWDHREGFLNVDLHDFHKPDLVADVTKLDMLPDAFYEEIVAQDVLEHLPRTETINVLRSWARLLQPGGRLYVRVPSVIDLIALMQRPEHQNPEQHERFVQCLFGTQAYTEDCHYTTFTEVLLRHQLSEAGLDVEAWGMRDEWLFDIVAVRPAPPMTAADDRGRGRLGQLAGRLSGKRPR